MQIFKKEIMKRAYNMSIIVPNDVHKRYIMEKLPNTTRYINKIDFDILKQ